MERACVESPNGLKLSEQRLAKRDVECKKKPTASLCSLERVVRRWGCHRR